MLKNMSNHILEILVTCIRNQRGQTLFTVAGEQCNKVLINRGSLIFWIDEEAIRE
jgi:hypothetical protein